MRNRTILAQLILLICCCAGASAQTADYTRYLRKAGDMLGSASLSYRYRVLLVENKTGKVVDSMSGRLYKSGSNFLDSNATALSLLSGNYFFKADPKGKYAYIYDLSLAEKKMGIKRAQLNNAIVNIPDSLLQKMGKASIDGSDPGYIGIRYTLRSPVNGIRDLLFRLDKKDESLAEIKIEVAEEDKWGDATGYRRIYYLFRFSNTVPAGKFNTGTYFKKEAGKARLQGIYKSYKLSSLI